jgi:ATP-dependent DNA helicase DinG
VRAQPVRIAIDLETTGLRPEQDAIVEIGALKFAGDDVLDTFEALVAPGVPLPYRIQRLTGITPAQLRDAPPLSDVLPRLRTFLGDAPLVGHSVPFDAAFLHRHGIARRNPLVDTYELASALLPGLANYSLAAVGAALGVHSPTYHRALADARLSRDVFLALLARLDALDGSTLAALGRLATPPDWTVAYFVRQELRARGQAVHPSSAGDALGTLGDQLAAKLGMNPAVLSLAIPRDTLPLLLDVAPSVDAAASPSDSVDDDAARANAITASIRDNLTIGGPLLIEAQNDVTSLIACLAPAVAWAHEQGERVIVSAADGESLRRLARHLLPRAYTAAGVAPADVPAAELAERDAYLCLHRWFGAARLARDGQLPHELARGLAKLTVWAGVTRTGTVSEVALAGQEQAAWDRARSGVEFADSIAGCAYRRDGYCLVARAQDAAAEARLVLTTHRGLAAHLAGEDDLLPAAARVLVLDAHLLDGALREAQSTALDRQELLARLAILADVEPGGRRAGLLHLAAQRLDRTGEARERTWAGQIERARQYVERFFQALERLLAEAQGKSSGSADGGAEGGESRMLRIDAGTRQLTSWAGVTQAWAALDERLATVAKAAREAAQLTLGAAAVNPPAGDGLATDLLGAARLLDRTRRQTEDILHAADESTRVYWLRVPYPQSAEGDRRRDGAVAQRPRGKPGGLNLQAPDMSGSRERPNEANGGAEPSEAPELHSAPCRSGELLAPLWAPGSGVVLASPALAVAGDFTYARVSLGLPDTTQTLGSSLDRADQTLLCLPTDVPEPNAPQFQRRLDDALVSLAVALGGDLVAIFPSHAALRSSALAIRRLLERHDILVLAQGQDGSARQIWQTFRTEPRVVLLGAGAFWEGAEQEKRPPACVVVSRVPFPALADPLLGARAEQWPDPQSQFVVPHAALRVRHALGGLAWSHRRRNAVVLFDRRLQTRSYGPTILGTLPRCTQYQETMAQVAERAAEWVAQG